MSDIPLPPYLGPHTDAASGHTTVGLRPFPPSLAPGWHLYIDPDTGSEEWVGPGGPSNELPGPNARPIGWWGYDSVNGRISWHPQQNPPLPPPGRWVLDPEKGGYVFISAPSGGALKESQTPTLQVAATLMTVERGYLRIVVGDREGNIGRRFGWEGGLQLDGPREVLLDNGGSIIYLPEHLTDETVGGPVFRSERGNLWELPKLPLWVDEDDGKLLGKGPITLTPGGAHTGASKPEDVQPPPLGTPPIHLDPFGHVPPLTPWPLWPWGPSLDGPFKPPAFDFPPAPGASELFSPLSPEDEKLLFPKMDWLGPYQKPLDHALQAGLEGFLKKLGSSGSSIDGKEWESAGKNAAQKAGQEIWSWLWERFQKSFFGGKLDWNNFWSFVGDHPVAASVGIGIGLFGYGAYLGHEYSGKSKLKIDFGALKFEYDDSKGKGEWKFEFKFKFNF